MNGIDALKLMKSTSPGTDVIMLTIHEKNDLIFDAICAGASGYLTKGATGDEIVKAIRDVFDGGAPMNAQIARKVLRMFADLNVPQHDYGLTQREKEILSLMVDGHSMKQVADRLNVSYYTVDTHQKNIYLKLQVHTRSGAVAKVLKEHII
jgi:DNA-binding NarL/FixJ family response regulator